MTVDVAGMIFRVRRPGREAGTQTRERKLASYSGVGHHRNVAIPALDSGFPAGMTERLLSLQRAGAAAPTGRSLTPRAKAFLGRQAERHADRKGLLLLAQSGRAVEIHNDVRFQPRTW
ncbi:hypothetical protein [Thiohalocapsa marina]|uniref:hypothetical protein n=1 Tax=Thiohalocapsa marina TaxID=424902 RepID=UPI0036DD9C8B